jgi:DNA-binding NtrC family response regulator
MTDSHTRPVRVLVVDDEAAARSALSELLREEGYEVQSAADGYKALGRIEQWVPDVVITDVKMPALGGIELMAKLREQQPDTAVIIMTAFGSVEGAVEAMQLGADDYLSKPVHLPHLLLLLERVIARRALANEANSLRSALAERDARSDAEMIGQAKSFRDLVELGRQIAQSPVSVLISGQDGTGKQFLARQIHQWSGRRGPLVDIRCGAVGEAALERELFGVKTDDGPAQDGKLLAANEGTLLLADIDELPLKLQGSLVAFLQERVYSRIGDGQRIESGARLIATTSRDLEAEVKAGRFRSDLFYRLASINLRAPSLRERRDDIPLLAMHFLKRHAKQAGKRLSGCSERALGVLVGYEWPGNIVQLERCIERAVVLARGPEIEPRDLPRELMTKGHDDVAPAIPGASLWEIERYAILKTLEQVGGRTSKAAKILGISSRKIQYRINEYEDAARLASGSPGPEAGDDRQPAT